MVVLKLKQGLTNKDITYRFGVGAPVISNVFRTVVPILSAQLKNLIVWPDRGTIKHHMPECFKRKYKDCVCIIDCTEIFIERPRNLTARADTWSSYKHNNTIKYLLGITPSGAVSFLSAGWGGRTSDKLITHESDFHDNLTTGDCVLADRGFSIKEDLAAVGAVLKTPYFTKGKSQLSGAEVDVSRQLSNVQIHVERMIGRLKKFRYLQITVPLKQASS